MCVAPLTLLSVNLTKGVRGQSSEKPAAAAAMRITAIDLKRLNIIDEIVPEPNGVAHADPAQTADLLAPYLEKAR